MVFNEFQNKFFQKKLTVFFNLSFLFRFAFPFRILQCCIIFVILASLLRDLFNVLLNQTIIFLLVETFD